MRYLTLIFVMISFPISLFSQNLKTLTSGNSHLTTTNSNELVTPFSNHSNKQGGLLIPYHAGTPSPQSVAFLSFLMSGQLPNGEIWGYLGSNPHDPNTHGPLKPNGKSPESYKEAFDTLWTVQRLDLQRYLDDWKDGQIDENHPAIFAWPARENNVLLLDSIPLPDQDLAPFFDRNGNDIYEPMKGEYPTPKGNLSGRALPTYLSWCVFNTGSPELHNLEYQLSFFAYSCDENPKLNNSIFFELQVINRSTVTIDSLKTGFYFNGELGCEDDDLWGTDTALNTAYFYNEKDGMSHNCYIDYPASYKTTQAFTLLNTDLFACTSPEVIQQIEGLPLPSNFIQFNNLLNGLKTNGEFMPYGWGSQLEDTTQHTKFLFTDPPSNTNGWNMANSNLENARKGVYVSTLIPELGENESIEISAALVFEYDTLSQYDKYTIVDKLLNQSIPYIKQQFSDGFPANECSYPSQFCNPGDCVWPGDSNNDQICFLDDFINTGWLIKEQKAGAERLYENDLWEPNYSDNWDQLFNNIDLKYADASGDGKITERDLTIVQQNFQRTTPSYTPTTWRDPLPSDDTVEVGDIVYKNYLDTPAFLYRIELPITITSNSTGVTDLHSICFSLEWDEELFLTERGYFDLTNEVYTSIEGKFLEDLNKRSLHLAITELKDTSYNGNIRIVNIRLHLKPDLLNATDTNRVISTPIRIFNLRALNREGEEIPLSTKNGSVRIQDLETTNTATGIYTENLQIYPNPVNNILNIKTDESSFNSISIFDINGRIIKNNQVELTHDFSCNIANLKSGVYFIQVTMNNGTRSLKRFVKY